MTLSKQGQSGSALILVMIMSGVALAILAGVMLWSSQSSRLTHRTIQYTRSVAAAEAATEKVVSQISRDFLYGGENLVMLNLSSYRQNTVPTTGDSSYWGNWTFSDGNGNVGQTYVQQTGANQYVVLGSTYAGLKGYVTTFTIVSHASDKASPQDVPGGVYQELQLTGIPIFQFAMYSMGDMEISCGQPFVVTGPVHANNELFIEPDNSLTFLSGVTAVVDVVNGRNPLDTRGPPAGLPANYALADASPSQPQAPFQYLNLPIGTPGTTNSPEMIREIIEPPPAGEDPTSALGRLRYYNECDMIVTVSDNAVTATSGMFNNKVTVITNTDVALFISTNSNFYDPREGKTVMPVDIDVGSLKTWSETNATLRLALGLTAPANLQSSIYVVDNRNITGSFLPAVRVTHGAVLGTNGLTVATGQPLYVWKDFNQYNSANLGTSNTLTTRPASLVADAITILSDNWTDENSRSDVSARTATPTTVNAAILTGVVETTAGHYSGGMENFPRFLETWGATIFTYNGSMVKMFPSKYATGVWGQGNVYVPPKRNWAYDSNFNDPTKLPPKTPSLLVVQRNRWSTVAPDTNGATAFR
ncbi:MAG TPA: hypothetical protein VG347_14185 [Verrucomicrobiae bacterium]|nr:hypothetical protein [Verrucomicrobiae bacterium]